MKSVRIFLLLIAVLAGACSRDGTGLFDPDFEVYALLPVEGLGDRSFVDVVFEGIEVAKKDFNFRIKYVIPDSLAAGENWIAGIPNLASSLPTLVIIAGNQYRDAVDRLEGKFGNNKLLLLAVAAKEYDGLASVTYRTYAPSYLGGYLSTGLIPGCRALVVEAFDAPFLREFRDGFEQGVTDAGGVVNTPVYLAPGFEGFSMSDSAYSLTRTLLPENDLIYALADGSNFGIINAARDYDKPRYVIGIDADQSWMGLTVVTGSVVILYGLEIHEYISEFSAGRFSSGHFTRSMEDGNTSFLINKLVLGGITVPDSLIKTAVEKERGYKPPEDRSGTFPHPSGIWQNGYRQTYRYNPSE